MCVGLLGEAPVNTPTLYTQLNVQCAILSVYLAALAQQVTAIAFHSRNWIIWVTLINASRL